MNQIERVADGKRRFFPAAGTVDTVFLRDRKGHADRALEPGRDYEIERGGVALTRVPMAGERVIILIGNRTRSDTTDLAIGQDWPRSDFAPVVIETERVVEREVPVFRDRVVEIPVERLVPVSTTKTSGEVLAGPANSAKTGQDRTNPVDLEPLKRQLVGAIWKTNDGIPNRTAEWQDALARRAASIWTANTMDDVKAAFARVEAFLRGAA